MSVWDDINVGPGSGFNYGSDPLDLTGQRSSAATQNAINAQTEATRDANNTERYIYDTNRSDLQPWRDAGVTALGGLQEPGFQKTFSMADFQADPGYQFRMDEGTKALERSAAAGGNLNSGATLKALTRYQQGTAAQEYQSAYDRYNNDQTTRFNRLASIAGVGQTANGQQVASGTNYGNNVSANQIGLGNGIAAANIAGANRQSNMTGQIIGAGTTAAVLASDRRLKMNIEPISKEDLKELKETLRAYKFNYKSKAFGSGDWIGVMAQDLEKSRLGRTLVFEDVDGFKKINVDKLMSLLLATLAEG